MAINKRKIGNISNEIFILTIILKIIIEHQNYDKITTEYNKTVIKN